MSKVFLFLSLLWISFGTSAQVLENYDDDQKLSKITSWMGSESQMNYSLDLSTYPLANLALKIPAECTLFMDGKLWFIAERDTLVFSSLKDLSAEFGKKKVELILVGGELTSENVSIKKVLEKPSSAKVANTQVEESTILPLPRRKYINEFADFYFVSLFVILFILALYKIAYPYLLAVLLQPLSVINAEDFSDSGSLQKFFSFDIQLYLFIVSMMISQVILTTGIIFKPTQVGELIDLDFISLLVAWLGMTVFVHILTIVKFIAIRIISYLFDLGKTDFAHFFYLLRMLVFSVSLVSIATAFLMVNDFSLLETSYSKFVSGLFWIYLFAVLGLFLIMMSKLSFKKYHLFTYLCIAELVPFLILSKWIWVLIQ